MDDSQAAILSAAIKDIKSEITTLHKQDARIETEMVGLRAQAKEHFRDVSGKIDEVLARTAAFATIDARELEGFIKYQREKKLNAKQARNTARTAIITTGVGGFLLLLWEGMKAILRGKGI